MNSLDMVAMIEKQLEKYPSTALDVTEVAEVLNVDRKFVDKITDEGALEYFVLDPNAVRKRKRVTKAALIAFMIHKPNQEKAGNEE